MVDPFALLFLGGSRAGALNSGMGQETGGAGVGQLLEGPMDLRFELGEGAGVVGQLVGPDLLLLGQGGVHFLEGLLQRRDGLARL